jgi:ammonium transporter, Amt family
LRAQAIGSATCVIVVGSIALIVMSVIKSLPGTWNLRVERDGELEGLDLHEHGTAAYHVEFGQGMTYSTPANLPTGRNTPFPVDKAEETKV